MIIYKDIFSNDELSSDTYPMQLIDDLIYEFKGKYEIRKEGEIVLPGANPSQEEQTDDGTDESIQRGVDIVLNHQLVEMPVYQSLSVFKEWVKEYVKKLVDHMKTEGVGDDELKTFKTKIQGWVSGIMKKRAFSKSTILRRRRREFGRRSISHHGISAGQRRRRPLRDVSETRIIGGEILNTLLR